MGQSPGPRTDRQSALPGTTMDRLAISSAPATTSSAMSPPTHAIHITTMLYLQNTRI